LFLIHAAARMCTPTLMDLLQVLADPLLHGEEKDGMWQLGGFLPVHLNSFYFKSQLFLIHAAARKCTPIQ
jgi:hypothetical protein